MNAPLPKEGTRCVDVFLEFLRAEGIQVVFGVPGGLLHPFFEGVESDPSMRLIVTKHEEGAAFMADGYYRVSSKMAVAAGTSGPGSTNLITGVACAFADGVPMLVVTGQAASTALGRGAAQETSHEDIDIVTMFKSITKYSAMVRETGNLAFHLRRAFRLAYSDRPGPVHLNIPVNMWGQPLQEKWYDPNTYRPQTVRRDREAISAAARALVQASHPTILSGSGVALSGGQKALAKLAEELDARVVTSPRGKGTLPEDHPCSLGVFGFAGHPQAREVIFGDQVDVLLVVGASLNETTTFNWADELMPQKTLIKLDIDSERIGRNYPVDIALVGDAKSTMIELLHCVEQERGAAEKKSQWSMHDPVDWRSNAFLDQDLRKSNANPVSPQRWRADLQEVLPDNAIIFSDIGGHMLFNINQIRIMREQMFVLNLGFGSMGHGTAAPLGASLALPHRPVVALVGDGCVTMNGMEMITAVEYDIPVIWVVENNQMHGITWHGSQLVGSGRPMESIRYRKKLHLAKMAEAMGLPSWVVTGPDQIQSAMTAALATGQACLIEVLVDGEIAPPIAERAKTIAGLTEK